MAVALFVLALIALYILSDKYEWARLAFGGIVFCAFVLFLALL